MLRVWQLLIYRNDKNIQSDGAQRLAVLSDFFFFVLMLTCPSDHVLFRNRLTRVCVCVWARTCSARSSSHLGHTWCCSATPVTSQT